ncbi:hypothetical protein X943_000164 [Babesia divergens]|uniref:6-Cys domain-containing protein n=1 Tax=Babesia divergens TaxID=32595 RepID=A0AAD9GJ63_BABDI|nr:hypothetical protein X943_000164 [Babesia divergens]
MKNFQRRIQLVVSLATLFYGQSLFHVHHGLVVDAAGLSLSNTSLIADETIIAYANEVDINPDGDNFKEVVLKRGQSVIYGCGAAGMRRMGDITMLPSKPQLFSLIDDSTADVKDRAKRTLAHHFLYRSDMQLVGRPHDPLHIDQLLIQYPKDAIIMAKRPENFSLNFGCKFVSKDGKATEIYKWLKVTFRDVYPMAYGCESGFNQLFLNSAPLSPSNYFRIKYHINCYVDPKPGMFIGIYCQPGEKVHPPNCLSKTVSQSDLKVVKFDEKNFDPSFKYDNKSDRLRLFRVPKEGINENVEFGCSCQDSGKWVTKMLIVSNKKDEVIDISRLIKLGDITERTRLRRYVQIMRPGKTVKMVVPADEDITLHNETPATAYLIPENVQVDALINMDSNQDRAEMPLRELVATRGFSVDKHQKHDMIEYTFACASDAIIVLKKTIAAATYDWELWTGVEGKMGLSGIVAIELNFVPTDPFTYGCGVDSRDLFHSDATKVSELKTEDGGLFTECYVSGDIVSPIGFYCPSGYTLDPPDCFTRMKLASTGETVPISAYLPEARALPGNNIRVLDTSIMKSGNDSVKYSDDTLLCKCIDKDGVDRAVIHIHFSEERGEMSTHGKDAA